MTSTRRLPADWEPHAASILAWPGRTDVWQPYLDLAKTEAAQLAKAIAADEPLILAVREGDLSDHRVEALLDCDNVSALVVPLDDCWARDISPTFAIERGDALAVQFPFNGWGCRFQPHNNDRAFAQTLAEHLGLRLDVAPVTLEGGAITTNGHGVAIAVSPTIVNDNRNPGWKHDQIEEELRQRLGITTMIWLDAGLTGDTDTDGHVDNVAVFGAESTLICQSPAETMNETDRRRVQTNLHQLKAAFEQRGKPIQIIEIPWLPTSSLDSERPCSYLNVCFTNSSLLVPTVGATTDDLALELYQEVFRDRTVVGLPSDALAYGGGGLHCMTAHLPGGVRLDAIQSIQPGATP